MTNATPVLRHDANQTPIQQSYHEQAFQGEYTGANLIYKGFAKPGSGTSAPVWQIAKLTYSGANLTAITWPHNSSGAADSSYSFVWDNRATYTYS